MIIGSGAITLLTFNCHLSKYSPPPLTPLLLPTTPQPIRYQMTLINGISPPLYFPSVSQKNPCGLLLCPETLNIHIFIILIFKSIKRIAPDKTNSNYLCSDREIYLVWWVTVGETWGWMSASLPLPGAYFLFIFMSTVLLLSRLPWTWKRIAGRAYEEFWKWNNPLLRRKKITHTLFLMGQHNNCKL